MRDLDALRQPGGQAFPLLLGLQDPEKHGGGPRRGQIAPE